MCVTTLISDDLRSKESLFQTDGSSSSLMPRRLNSKGEVCLVLPPEIEKAFQAKEQGRLLEAQRLKERLSRHPLHGKRAAERGERYWHDLASTYQGTK